MVSSLWLHDLWTPFCLTETKPSGFTGRLVYHPLTMSTPEANTQPKGHTLHMCEPQGLRVRAWQKHQYGPLLVFHLPPLLHAVLHQSLHHIHVDACLVHPPQVAPAGCAVARVQLWVVVPVQGRRIQLCVAPAGLCPSRSCTGSQRS